MNSVWTLSLLLYCIASCQLVTVKAQQVETEARSNLRGNSELVDVVVVQVEELAEEYEDEYEDELEEDEETSAAASASTQYNRTLKSPLQFSSAFRREDVSSKRMQPRIVGGNQAGFGEYPYYVDMGRCGGTLIAPDVILTAAHCGSFSGERVIVGAYINGDGSTQGATTVTVVDWARHPQFNEALFRYDFALLKISPPVNLNTNVQFSLNSQRNLQDYENLDVVGMGSQFEGGPLSNTVRDVTVRSLPSQLCQRRQWYSSRLNDETMFCAGYRNGGRDACQGDSGAPILRKIGNQHIQVGIVSWGDGCARARKPGVYARVSVAYSWIRNQACNRWGSSGGSLCSGGTPSQNQNSGSNNNNQYTNDPNNCGANQYKFDFYLKTDGDGAQISWSLANRANGARLVQQSNLANWQEYRAVSCIPIAPYQLLIQDQASDGLQGGGYELRLNGGLSLSTFDNVPFSRRTIVW
ncbi:unnamed protein product [Cylindrotheca closterium]|uniref:Peptidase S1 domain-containing protein n=1 Tax=Cylindrotheca closterium TaxID=2856 RepID=A0AAD2GDT2_9STRA|nr:unnamed protein product [Cylindrotheca closterium]